MVLMLAVLGERALGDDDDAVTAAGGVARLMRSTTRSMSYGISGSRMTCALPATPACMAIQPA